MAISLGSGFFTIRAKDEATQATRQIGEGVRASLGELAQTAVTTMAVAGTAVLGFLGTSVKAFADSERAHAQLEAALKSTAGAAGISAAELDKYAEAAQKTTAYEDDAVTAAQALMLTFTNIGREVFPKAMDAVLDMSTAMGQDLKGSVIQIGKALNDPIQGITALTRVGVSFTDQQKEMIKALVEGGNVAAAQQMILAELAKEFGGSATAEAKTFTGQLKQMWNQFGDLQEEIGGALVPVLKDMMEQLRPILQALADWIEKNPEATTSVLEWAGAIGAVSIALKALMPVFTLVRGGFIAMKATVPPSRTPSTCVTLSRMESWNVWRIDTIAEMAAVTAEVLGNWSPIVKASVPARPVSRASRTYGAWTTSSMRTPPAETRDGRKKSLNADMAPSSHARRVPSGNGHRGPRRAAGSGSARHHPVDRGPGAAAQRARAGVGPAVRAHLQPGPDRRRAGHRPHRGRDRPPGARHAAHVVGAVDHRSRHRRVPGRAAGADPGPAGRIP